jgi:signal transduction histidine kinase
MRTPVASIGGYLSLALNPATATIDERAQKYLNAAHDASKHLGNLFRDLLDVTKFDDGKIRARFVPVELFAFVKELSDYYAPQFQNAKLGYRFGTEDARVLKQLIYASVDTGFMREVLGNLIENAIKYTPEGGTVYVNVRGDADRAVISVQDSGIGISADDLQHIFQKFYRADNSQTRTAGGTGLGLYLVKQRVEAMGGKVWAESQFGQGSVFYVSLPRITADEYQKRLIAYQNQQAVQSFAERPVMQNVQQNQINNGGVNTAQ